VVYTAVTQLSPVRHKSALCQLVRLAEGWGFYGCMNTQPRKHRILFQLMLTALLALSLQAADAGSWRISGQRFAEGRQDILDGL